MSPSFRARWVLPCLLPAASALSVLSASPSASAQSQQAQKDADALFTEGRDLLEKGRFPEACGKLARSEELAPAVGTLLNLGYCWEQVGKLRSAMDAYAEAEVLASSVGDGKRATFAKERFATVEPRAPRLVIRVAKPEPPDLVVTRNGASVPKSELDRPISVDPEDYLVTASAPGMTPWKGAIVVRGEGAVVTMIIPTLAPAPKVTAAPSVPSLSTRRIAALGLGAAGALAIGAGIVAGVTASARYDDASVHCDGTGCDEVGNRIQRSAVTQGNVGTALVGLGVLCAGAGVFLWLIGGPEAAEPGPKRAGVERRSRDPLRLLLGGRF